MGDAASTQAARSRVGPTSLDPADDSGAPALDGLAGVAYEELRAIAHRRLLSGRRFDGRDQTLATTDLVHEAYLKLAGGAHDAWRDRAHFLATAAIAMRQILVYRARARISAKRGGARARITLDDEALAVADEPAALLEIDDALERLADVAPRLARVVECRFYGGMSEAEIAKALDVNVRTVQRDWIKARMLLRRALHS